MPMQYFETNEVFDLELGGSLCGLQIAYTTYGKLNELKNNVVWICHALTANSDPMEWWPSFINGNEAFNISDNLIICANILGSCYGTTGPLTINRDTGTPYYRAFPMITIRDMVKAHQLLAIHLGIEKIELLIGSSMGGYQALEWSLIAPEMINKLFLIATSAKETPWGIAIHTAQRLAIESDSSFTSNSIDAGKDGLKAARAFGMITYRSFASFELLQSDKTNDKTDDFKVSSYIRYQGEKLVERFNAYSYWTLSKSMDSHNIARGRNKDIETVLKTISQHTLVIGITSDILCPTSEQKCISNNIPFATYKEMDSIYGHDGFLVEGKLIHDLLANWLQAK